MNAVDAIKTCLKKYDITKGRASRSEYWWFTTFLFVLGFIFGYADESIGYNYGVWIPYTISGIMLFFLIPNITVTIRRLHDVGLSGWFLLLFIIAYTIAFYFTAFGQLIELQADGNQNPLVTPVDIKPVIDLSALFSWETLVVAIGFIVMAWPSRSNPNKYGPNPNEVPS